MHRLALPIVLLLVSGASPAQDGLHPSERLIPDEFTLSQWCEDEARHRYIARDITPYQWTSRYFARNNVLHVEGRLRVRSEDVSVRCRVARGARAQYAVIEIDDPALR